MREAGNRRPPAAGRNGFQPGPEYRLLRPGQPQGRRLLHGAHRAHQEAYTAREAAYHGHRHPHPGGGDCGCKYHI